MGRKTGKQRNIDARNLAMREGKARKAAEKAAKEADADKENLSPVEEKLKATEAKLEATEERLDATKKKLAQTTLALKNEKRAHKNTRNRERRHIKAREASKRQKQQLKLDSQAAWATAERRVRAALADTKQNMAELERKLLEAEKKLAEAHTNTETFRALNYQSKSQLVILRKTIHNLKRAAIRARDLRRRCLDKAHEARTLAKMKHKHAYKPQIRTLARLLVSCGCGEGKIGKLVQDVAAVFGVTLDKVMSRRTIRRIVLEGLVMSRVQSGHEMSLTEDITFSGDSTSRRNQNYQAHHATYRTLEFDSDGTMRLSVKPITRFLGVRSTVDHSTEKSKESWLRVLQEIMDIYNASPLAQRTRLKPLDLAAICRKLRGMCSDHASGEKATSDAMKEVKIDETLKDLGREKMAQMESEQLEELEKLLYEWNFKKMEEAGGFAAYMALSPEEQAARDIATVNAMMRSLGEEAMKELPAEEQRLLTLYVWSGCCMHKEQNSFKGGNAAMMAAWKKLGFTAPIVLANKANADILRKIVAKETGSKELTEEQLAAIEASTCGGAKLTSLAGAIFNNHVDKRGQGDTHTIYLSYQLDDKLETLIKRFPRTSNTRFGSHGEAAAELLSHLKEYRDFLEHIKTKKVGDAWTNIELNVYNGLDDDPTLTELAVMALYQQLITHPYMRIVRAREDVALNALDLGPMHAELLAHCQRLIDNPELILDFDEDCHEKAAFDGLPFERPDAVDAIEKMVDEGKLQHLKEIFVSFLEGAKVTWLRFSSEFAPGGLIDGMSDDEKYRAFLNATNDRNEGALGSFCVYARNHPTASVHTHNALATYTRNGTQRFVDALFGSEDHLWAMRAARKIDESGWEKARLKEQAEFEMRMVEMKRVKIAARIKRAKEKQTLLDNTIIVDIEAVDSLTGKLLDIQLDKLRALWGTKAMIPKKCAVKLVAEKKAALKAALSEHARLIREGSDVEMEDPGVDEGTESVEITVEAWCEEEDDEFEEI